MIMLIVGVVLGLAAGLLIGANNTKKVKTAAAKVETELKERLSRVQSKF